MSIETLEVHSDSRIAWQFMPGKEALEEALSAGRRRLYPSLSNPNWLVLRARRRRFQRWLERIPGHDLNVLDVGGRIQPYRDLLAGRANYVAVDLRSTPLLNAVANAEQLPLADERFDLVVCTQMLEYAPDPSRVIAEIHRVLKPGAVLLLSVPSLALRDSDEDRWRLWPAGIRQLLASFSEVEIVPEVRSIAGLFRTVNVGLHSLAPSFLRAVLSCTLVPVLNLAGLALESLVRSHNDAFAVNYSVFARK
jgi:SAM-dependent methyltransferase